MESDNVDVIRRWHAAVTAGGDDMLSAVQSLWDEDSSYFPARKFPDAKPCHGRAEVAAWMERFLESFVRHEWTTEEAWEISDDRILARQKFLLEGRGSGIRLEGDVYACAWLRHGRFMRVENHLTLSGALHALGLVGETLEDAGVRE